MNENTIPTAVTEEDIRMFLVDKAPEDNFLLDNVEMTNEEINKAITWTVDKYNMIPPFIHVLTADRIPHYLLVIGTSSMLLRMKALNYMRNRLDYQQSNSTSIQDKNKAAEYLAMSKELMAEFNQIATQLKYSANLDSCYGRVGSPYRLSGLTA